MASPLDRLPDPFRLRAVDDAVDEEADAPRANINLGRSGSPNVVIGLPFSKVDITEADATSAEHLAALTSAVAQLAGLVARLAPATDPDLRAEATAIADAVDDLATQLGPGDA